MADIQRGLKWSSPFVTDGTTYAKTVLERRRDRAIADLFRLHRDRLLSQQGGCMVRVFPTDYTDELKRFSHVDHHVRWCIDSLFKDGLNATDMFLEGLVHQFSHHSTEDDDEVENELQEIDRLRDDFQDTLLPHLERCIQDATLNIIRYGFTPLGYQEIDNSRRVVPYVPNEFVIVRLQPSGEYLCHGIDAQTDQGPFELFFFRSLTDEERPNSDLAMLLPLRKKLELVRKVHDRSLMLASRPYIVTAQVQDGKEGDDLFEDEKRERQKAKLRERMLRDQVNQGTSTAMRFAELAAALSTDGSGSGVAFGGAEELSGSGFMASTVRRTHQEMADKLFTLKTKHHHERQKLNDKIGMLEELLQRYIDGRAGETVDLPVRYQLPEGSSHVGSHLNVRPNALNYDMYERLYQVEIARAILGTKFSQRVGVADTRQGVARSLVAAVDNIDETSISTKSVILQRFLIQFVLSSWLDREELPMTPLNPIRKSMNLDHFHLADRILYKGRMKLWLMCNTGYRAKDISMAYRENDPYHTGQAVVVPQPVVPIAATKRIAVTSEEADLDEEQDEGSDQEDYNNGNLRLTSLQRKRLRR